MIDRPLSPEEKQWRAQSDVETLKRAQEIQQDRARLKAAQGYANKLVTAVKPASKAAPAKRKSK